VSMGQDCTCGRARASVAEHSLRQRFAAAAIARERRAGNWKGRGRGGGRAVSSMSLGSGVVKSLLYISGEKNISGTMKRSYMTSTVKVAGGGGGGGVGGRARGVRRCHVLVQVVLRRWFAALVSCVWLRLLRWRLQSPAVRAWRPLYLRSYQHMQAQRASEAAHVSACACADAWLHVTCHTQTHLRIRLLSASILPNCATTSRLHSQYCSACYMCCESSHF